MFRARAFIVDHGIASMPPPNELSVIATPEYLRNVMPFAAYFPPAKFDAMRRRHLHRHAVGRRRGRAPCASTTRASISNTSIHEAYPGHHLQLSAALDTSRASSALLVDAPEFVEGWGMYCEQMMREEGFDASPEHRPDDVHRCHLASLPDHPRHPAPSRRDRRRQMPSTSWSSTPASSAPTPTAEVQRYTLDARPTS